MSRLFDEIQALRALGVGPVGPARLLATCGLCGRLESETGRLVRGARASVCKSCTQHALMVVFPALEADPGSPPQGSAAIRADPGAPAGIQGPLITLGPRPEPTSPGPPSDRNSRASLVEASRARALRAQDWLDQISAQIDAVRMSSDDLTWALEEFLGSAGSDKLLAVLPWSQLGSLAALQKQLALLLERGDEEARRLAGH